MTRLLTLFILLLAAAPAQAEAPALAGQALVTGAAWDEFCDRLKGVGQSLLSEYFPGSEAERAAGFHHLARTVGMALQWEIDFADPAFPAFYRHDDDVTKWGGPNVDNADRALYLPRLSRPRERSSSEPGCPSDLRPG